MVLCLSLTFVIDPIFSLFLVSGFVKKSELTKGVVQQLETEGLWKIESAVVGSEAEGLYGFLSGAISHSPVSPIPPPPKTHCNTPTATISELLPWEPEEAAPEASSPAVREVNFGTGSALLSCVTSSGGGHPCPYGTPLPVVVGHWEGLQVTGGGVQWRAINLTGYNLHTCAQRPFGSEVGMSLLCQDFPKLRCPQASQENSQLLMIFTWYIYFSLPLNLLFLVSVEGHFMCLSCA